MHAFGVTRGAGPSMRDGHAQGARARRRSQARTRDGASLGRDCKSLARLLKVA
jgi:hypothetical protein